MESNLNLFKSSASKSFNQQKLEDQDQSAQQAAACIDQLKDGGAYQVFNCFELAQKQDTKLSTGCRILNDFLR